ncbi:replication initiation protein [Algibacter pectinivorans]|uniref:Initiator Replication protein n=1 Tax=Algibacter pectinivorans TaxID=870482 RepID=A0A1I1RUN6_9FLAO|nr:replication initiation protein [Algibacter pectinivorans]SFD35243.1 Initiator Replication protein [Algibacter pectinivorans]
MKASYLKKTNQEEATRFIKKPNHILTARFALSTLEKNIIYTVLDQLQKVMSKDLNQNYKEQEVIVELKLLDKHRNYHRIKNAVKSLGSKQVEFEMNIPNGNRADKILDSATLLVSGLTYERNSEYISFWVPSSACRFFCYIGGGYTSFQKTIAISLTTNPAKCMYELCCRWIDKGGFECTVEEFRLLMNTGEKYKQISHLRTRFLEDPKQELKKRADVFFSFKLHKRGSSYYSITFKFHRNTEVKDEYRGIDSKQYIFVYNFLNRFYSNQMDTKALDYSESIAQSGKIDKAYSRFLRLDDDYTSGKKTKADIKNLLNKLILKEVGVKGVPNSKSH